MNTSPRTPSALPGAPRGVETAPQPGRLVVTSVVAGRILGLSAAQVRRRVDSGEVPGGAEPRPQRARYYVYADALRPDSRTGPPPDGGVDADTYARIASLETANLLLLASEQYMRDAAASAAQAADHLRLAERARAEEVRSVRLADEAKADALSAFVVPGHAGLLRD